MGGEQRAFMSAPVAARFLVLPRRDPILLPAGPNPDRAGQGRDAGDDQLRSATNLAAGLGAGPASRLEALSGSALAMPSL
jgi:hypothetical protein